MERLLQIGLSNAILAAALAFVALLMGKALRRPALTHALWLIVLLKLITPPIWAVPVGWSFHWGNETKPALAPVTEVLIETARDQASDIIEPELSPQIVRDASPSIETDVKRLPSVVHISPAPAQAPQLARWLPSVLAGIWLVGAVLCLAVGAIRIGRFYRSLRYATPAPRLLQQQAFSIAARLGLSECPPVCFIPGKLSPMLFSLGTRSKLLIPASFWARLDEEQRATLLAHELAHLRRRDHWVRWLEMAVTALYWWYPLAWWARRELHEAEEQCCDAWVLWAIPGCIQQYASALLEAIDFLSGTPPAVPALASGIGQFHQLKRRLIMIRHGEVARRLSWTGLSAVCGMAGLLLPLAPALAQKTPGEKSYDVVESSRPATIRVDANEVAAKEDEVTAKGDVVVTRGDVLINANADDNDNVNEDPAAKLDKPKSEHNRANGEAELAKARAEVTKRTQQLEAAQRRLAEVEGKYHGDPARVQVLSKIPVIRRLFIKPPPSVKLDVVTKDGMSVQADPQQRLAELEQRLEDLTKEMHSLRQELKRPDANRKF